MYRFFTSEQNGHLIISCFNVEDDWICSCNQIKWYFCSRQRWGITFLKVFFVFFLAIYSCGVIGQWLFFKIARSNSILIKNSRLRRQSRSLPKMQSWWGWAITSLTFEVVTWNKWHEIQVCPLPWKMCEVYCMYLRCNKQTPDWKLIRFFFKSPPHETTFCQNYIRTSLK